jgi:hypothetical protein
VDVTLWCCYIQTEKKYITTQIEFSIMIYKYKYGK